MEASTAGAERSEPPVRRRRTARAADDPGRGPAAYAAEFLGTLMLVFAVTAIVVVHSGGGLGVTDWAVIGLVHAFILMLLVYSLGGASGAHFNPAVTIALMAGRKIRPPDAAIYIVVQLAGAVAGAFLTKLLLDDEGAPIDYGLTQVAEAPEAPQAQPGVPAPPAQGADWLDGKALPAIVAEAIGTFFLMWAIMAVAVNPRGNRHWAGWIIGGTLGMAVMIFGPMTGGSLNPARTFGPAVVGGNFGDFLVYVIGPVVGAVLAYALYTAIVLNPQDREPGERPIDALE